jgi:hypothetical protein
MEVERIWNYPQLPDQYQAWICTPDPEPSNAIPYGTVPPYPVPNEKYLIVIHVPEAWLTKDCRLAQGWRLQTEI